MAATPEPPAQTPSPARRSNFISEVFVELKKVTWPTLPEAWRLTMVVLFVIISVAVFVGAIDYTLSMLTAKFKLIK